MKAGQASSVREGLTYLTVRLDSRPLRFLLVGVSGVGVSMLVLWTAREELRLPIVAAGVASWVISTFTNFQLNDRFTWQDRRSRSFAEKMVRLLRYYGTTVAGMLVTLGTLVVLTEWLGLHLLLANLLGIGAGGTFNYIIHNFWTWKGRGSP